MRKKSIVYMPIRTKASTWVIRRSLMRSEGVMQTKRMASIEVWESWCLSRIPLPKIARRGIMRRKITIIPPIKLPTKISGSLEVIEVRPRANSGIEVMSPRIKKDALKLDIRNLRENLVIDSTIKLAPNQIE